MVMKKWMICLACFGSVVMAAEPVVLPLDLGTFKTLDNKVYEEAKVIGSDAVGIKIMHAGGTARIIYDRLPRDLAAKFEVKPEAAREQLEKEAAAAAAHEREMKIALKEEKKPGAEDGKPVSIEGEEEEESVWGPEELLVPSSVVAAERIRMIEAYIVRVNKQIAEMEKDVERRRARAAKVDANAGYDVNVNYDTRVATYAKNRSSVNRRDHILRMAAKQGEKLDEARKRVKEAELEIARLR